MTTDHHSKSNTAHEQGHVSLADQVKGYVEEALEKYAKNYE